MGIATAFIQKSSMFILFLLNEHSAYQAIYQKKNVLINKKIMVKKFSGKTSPFACGHTSNSVTINSLIFKEFLKPITDITFQKAGLDTN